MVISFSFFFSLRILEKSRFLLISILLFVFPLSLLKQVYASFYSINYPCILHIYELQNLLIFYSLDFHNGHRINRGTIPENGLYCWWHRQNHPLYATVWIFSLSLLFPLIFAFFLFRMEESCYLKCAIQEHPTHSIIDDNCVDRCIFKYKQAEAIVDSVLKYESQKKETNNWNRLAVIYSLSSTIIWNSIHLLALFFYELLSFCWFLDLCLQPSKQNTSVFT